MIFLRISLIRCWLARALVSGIRGAENGLGALAGCGPCWGTARAGWSEPVGGHGEKLLHHDMDEQVVQGALLIASVGGGSHGKDELIAFQTTTVGVLLCYVHTVRFCMSTGQRKELFD